MAAELTATFAIYGAVVASVGLVLGIVLAYREFRRERRSITITLEWLTHNNFAQVLISNDGFRPITINEIGMEIGDGPIWDRVPRQHLLTDESEEHLGTTLGDGEQLVLRISDHISQVIMDSNWQVRMDIFDAEGNQYTEFNTRIHNTRRGTISTRPD